MKVVESETSAATFVDVPAELFTSPIYANVRRAYGKVADIVGLPPYTVIYGKKSAGAETFEQLREAALELAKDGMQISRFKGLGEMNDEQLWETTMNPRNRLADPGRGRGRVRGRPALLDADGRPGRAAAALHRAERADVRFLDV